MIALLLKILSSKVLEALVLAALSKSVDDPKTQVDHKLVAGVYNAFKGLDSGLQRKPTGPRKKR